MFGLFVASVLLIPFSVTILINLMFGQEIFTPVTNNIAAMSILIGYLIAYGLTLYFARDYLSYTFSNLLSKVSPGFIFFAFLAGLIYTALIVMVMIFIEPPQDFGNSTEELLSGTAFSSGVLILFSALLAPIVEEFVFRAYIFDALKQKFAFITTAVISSFLFTLPHMPEYFSYWPAGLIIFSLGLLLAYFRKRTDSLLPCIVLHATYNIGFLGLFFISN